MNKESVDASDLIWKKRAELYKTPFKLPTPEKVKKEFEKAKKIVRDNN